MTESIIAFIFFFVIPAIIFVPHIKAYQKSKKEAYTASVPQRPKSKLTELQIAQYKRDIETAEETIKDLNLLMDAAQRRYHAATKDAEIEKEQRRIIAIRRQISAAENKIDKAKYLLNQ